MRVLVVSLLLSLAVPAAAGPVLTDGFDSGLGAWMPVVYNSVCSGDDPAPAVDTAFGNPAPSLNPNGNSCCGNGTYSAAAFDLSRGLSVEWDMFVAQGYDWNWGTGGIARVPVNVSAARADGAIVDSTQCDPPYLAWVQLIDDNAYGQQPAFLSMGIIGADGVGEGYYEPDATALQDAWHRYRVLVRRDGFAEFQIDGVVRWASTKAVDRSGGALPVLLGDRSSYGQGVRVDNVRVYPLVVPARILVRTDARGCVPNDRSAWVTATVLGDANVDVTKIRLDTVRLDGVAIRIQRGAPVAQRIDVNGDGVLDLQAQFSASGVVSARGAVTLTGALSDGPTFEGTASVCLR